MLAEVVFKPAIYACRAEKLTYPRGRRLRKMADILPVPPGVTRASSAPLPSPYLTRKNDAKHSSFTEANKDPRATTSFTAGASSCRYAGRAPLPVDSLSSLSGHGWHNTGGHVRFPFRPEPVFDSTWPSLVYCFARGYRGGRWRVLPVQGYQAQALDSFKGSAYRPAYLVRCMPGRAWLTELGWL